MQNYYLLEVSKVVCQNAISSKSEKEMSVKIRLYKEALTKIIPIKNEAIKAYFFTKYSALSITPSLSKKERIAKQKHDVIKNSLLEELESTKNELLKFQKPSLNIAQNSLSSTQYIQESRTYFKNIEVINSHIEKKEALIAQLDSTTSKLEAAVLKKKKTFALGETYLSSQSSKAPIKRLSFKKTPGTLIYQAGAPDKNKRTYSSSNTKKPAAFTPISGTQMHITGVIKDSELLFNAKAQ